MNDDKAKLLSGYQRMMIRVKDMWTHAAHDDLHQYIDAATEKAVELEELSREEAERIGDYLRRDLNDAAEFIANTEQSLGDWMRFDLELIEARLLDAFSIMVDQTHASLDNLAEQARLAVEWQSGEITGPGTLYCENCGQEFNFHRPSYILPCANCGGILFKRYTPDEEKTIEP